MPIIDGKEYSNSEVMACYNYWRNYLDKQEMISAIEESMTGVDPMKDEWVEANKMTLIDKAHAMLDDWRDEQEEALYDLDKSITAFMEQLIRKEWSKYEGELKIWKRVRTMQWLRK